MKRIKIYLMLLLVGAIFGIRSSLVEAAELNFSVKALLPENQIDKKSTFFDLRMTPGQQETVQVEVTNTMEESIEVLTFVSAAGTNVNGVIDYPQPTEETEYDATMQNPLPTIVEMPETITVGPKETVKVDVKINMPSEPYNGMIVGGLSFYEKDAETEVDEDTGGMGVKNKFMYRIGMKLTENDEEVIPDLVLLGAKAGQVNYRNAVLANLQNPESNVLNDLKLEAKVYAKGSSTPLYEVGKDDMKVAPNSNFEYPIYLGKKAFKAGKYTLKLEATAADDQSWSFEQDFEITKDEADTYNEESSVELEYETNWLLYGGIAGGVLVLLIILIIVIARSKIKKAQREALAQAQKKKRKKAKVNGKGNGNSGSKRNAKGKKSKDSGKKHSRPMDEDN